MQAGSQMLLGSRVSAKRGFEKWYHLFVLSVTPDPAIAPLTCSPYLDGWYGLCCFLHPLYAKGAARGTELTLMRVIPDTKNAKNHTKTGVQRPSVLKTGVQRQVRDLHAKAHLLVKL